MYVLLRAYVRGKMHPRNRDIVLNIVSPSGLYNVYASSRRADVDDETYDERTTYPFRDFLRERYFYSTLTFRRNKIQ